MNVARTGKLMLLLLVLLSYSIVEAIIVQPPTTQVILPGMTATFKCVTREGTSQWTVNGMTNREYWDSRGIKSTIDENLDPVTGNPITVLTLKMDGLEINNGSQIRCYSAVVMVDISAPASLVIAGPPLVPNSILTVLNVTHLKFSWETPFTWTEVANISNYTVSMYNSSSLEWKNRSVDPSLNEITIVAKGVAQECAELLFEVSANNVVGDSPASSVNGEFPIAIKWVDQDVTSRLSLSVHYKNDGSVLITVKVKPPIMCPTQMAKYDVTISDFTAGVQLAKTSVTHTYGDGSAFNITLTFFPIIKEERTYYVILSVTSFNFASLQSFASFNISPAIMPGISNTTFGFGKYGLIIGAASAGVFTIVLLTVIAITVAICCRLNEGKSSKNEEASEHHYHDAPVVPSHSFEHSTPLDHHDAPVVPSHSFEHSTPLDPVYACIDECQNLTTTTEMCPDMDMEEAENSSIDKCFPDHEYHTLEGEYIEMKVVVDSAEGRSCGEAHTRLSGGPFQETL